MAGSTDPLDRLWCWINSQDACDYADLVQGADGDDHLLQERDADGDLLTAAALDRIARARAVRDWQAAGPLAFFLHAAALSRDSGPPILDPAVIDVVERWRERIENTAKIDN